MEIARLKLVFSAILGVLAAAWLLSVNSAALLAGFWPLRQQLIPFTGILAIGCMSVAVLLAARPVQMESALGGLDKFYRLHKWLGVGGTIIAVVHWLLEVTPRWMVRYGWLARPQRPRAAGAAPVDPFAGVHDLAVGIGEWGLYLLLVLVVLALWKRFPYHLFFKTHRLMAPLFLAFAFHAVVLMPTEFWTAPVGPLTGLLLLGAVGAAALSLFRRIGQTRKAVGRVTSVHLHPGNAVLEVGVRLETAWPGPITGQFAFLDFDDPGFR